MNLSEVNPGEKLYIQNNEREWGSLRKLPYCVFIVLRLTAKQVVAKDTHGNEYRFWIEDGKKVGGSYGDFAFVPLPERIAEQVVAIKVRKAQATVQDKITKMGKLEHAQRGQ